MSAWREWLVMAFSLAGACSVLIALLGVVRLPDALCRAHALGKGMTLGLVLLLAGLWLSLGWERAGLKVVAAIAFQFLTIPVASHLLARLVFENSYPRHGDGSIDVDRTDRSERAQPPSG